MAGLGALDWIAIGAYLALALFVGLRFTRRASTDTRSYYLAGRSLSWWMAGTSLVATSFAADTPLVVTGWVRSAGISRNWLWWGMAVGGTLSFTVLAAYWRRAEITTDAEFIELRYAGRPARLLRGFYGGYHALVTNTIVLTWVLVAMRKMVGVVLDLPAGGTTDAAVVFGALAVALFYSFLSGLWGVVMTDFFQFLLAMGGALALAWASVMELGGLDGARAAFARLPEHTTALLPAPGTGSWTQASFWVQGFGAFLIFVAVQGWLNKNADGGGAGVQRYSACRDEGHARGAALWFHLAHYCLRPWPWILVALASLLIFPTMEVRSPGIAGRVVRIETDPGPAASLDPGRVVLRDDAGAEHAVALPSTGQRGWRLHPRVVEGDEVTSDSILASTDEESAYVAMFVKLLPTGLLGLMIASFLAAFMSTLDTHFNLASAYLVNDLYRRFLVRGARPRHYVNAGRVAELSVGVLAALLALSADSISDLFTLSLSLLGGLGPALLLRWFWWRANAWTEISALASSTLVTLGMRLLPHPPPYPLSYVWVIGISCLVMCFVTLATPPVPLPALRAFHARIRPAGWWGPCRSEGAPPTTTVPLLVGWVGGVALLYGLMLGAGTWLLGGASLPYWSTALVGGSLLRWSWRRAIA